VLARAWNRRDLALRFYLAMLAALGSSLTGAAALVAGPYLSDLDPASHVYPAIVWMLVSWTALHIVVGVIMLLYCLARRLAGRMSGRHDIDITNVTLYWHFTILTVVITVLVIAGFPLVA
jgi:cytochrome c oxidase subunit I+III